jgi:hypothetical protein
MQHCIGPNLRSAALHRITSSLCGIAQDSLACAMQQKYEKFWTVFLPHSNFLTLVSVELRLQQFFRVIVIKVNKKSYTCFILCHFFLNTRIENGVGVASPPKIVSLRFRHRNLAHNS